MKHQFNYIITDVSFGSLPSEYGFIYYVFVIYIIYYEYIIVFESHKYKIIIRYKYHILYACIPMCLYSELCNVGLCDRIQRRMKKSRREMDRKKNCKKKRKKKQLYHARLDAPNRVRLLFMVRMPALLGANCCLVDVCDAAAITGADGVTALSFSWCCIQRVVKFFLSPLYVSRSNGWGEWLSMEGAKRHDTLPMMADDADSKTATILLNSSRETAFAHNTDTIRTCLLPFHFHIGNFTDMYAHEIGQALQSTPSSIHFFLVLSHSKQYFVVVFFQIQDTFIHFHLLNSYS